MLTAVTLVALLGGAVLLAWTAQSLIDGLERRRLGRVVAEVRVTEAMHAALGAIVAPTITHHRGRPWTVTINLRPQQLALAGRLTEIAGETLGQEGKEIEVVFVPRLDGLAQRRGPGVVGVA
jgi:hypothetical protein